MSEVSSTRPSRSHLRLGAVALAMLSSLLISVCGSGSGYVFGSLGTPKQADPLAPKSAGDWSADALGALSAHLDLTPEQIETLTPILAGTSEKVTRERERALFQIHLNILKVHDDVRPHLTPQQQKELDSSREKMLDSIRERFSSLIGDEDIPGNPATPTP